MDQGNPSWGIPVKSKLRPYVDQIRKWRRAGFTWAAIAEKLEQQGCKTYATNLCQFMRCYRKRPFPSEAELENVDLVPVSAKPVKNARSSSSRDSSTPYFEELVC
jgi:hypothetical protein